MQNNRKINKSTSDGYHTFNGLYDHRNLLFVNLLLVNRNIAFKTRLDDKGKAYPGWFIAGINTDYGQITYHLPDKLWDLLDIKSIESNTDYDGHTPDDVLIRLGELIKAWRLDYGETLSVNISYQAPVSLTKQ